MTIPNAFRPRRTALALEPRILFDGAAGIAIEQQAPDAPAPEVAAPAPEAPPHTLVVIDTRLADYQTLARQAAPGAEVLLVDATQDGLAAISERLAAGGQVDSIQILSHGAAGQFTLGNRAVSADNVAALSETLRAWAPQLTADADILLYGCGVGAGESGRTLITALAAATGADVAASTNNTGSAAAGGDWTLEVATGAIETGFAADAYAGLLANAVPTVTLSGTPTEALLGGQFSFTASFANTEPSGQAGYAPFIDLILPATGKDGAGAEIDDGITFVSATYLGQTVKSYVLTFDATGNATHPLAKDSTGAEVIVTGTPGDQLVVLQLPYASVLKGQPAIDVVITCQLSELADTTGSPALNVKVRGGFEYGNDSANNPVSDPSLFGGISAFDVTPSGLTLTQSINMPEGETVTGPNFDRSLTVTATPPPGQTLTDVDITQSLPQTIRVNSITPASGGTITSITLADGSTVTNSVFITAVLAQSPFLSSYTIRYASLSAPAATVVNFYVPEKDYAGNDILDSVNGNDQPIILGQPTATGKWLPLDPRDQTIIDPGPPVVVAPADIAATGNDVTFVAKSVALRKSVAIAVDAGSAGLSPGDKLQYTLNIDLSDYFAMGKTLFNVGNLTIEDQLGDGQRLEAGSPILTVYLKGGQYVIPLVVTTGTPDADGTAMIFDIAQSLANTNAIFGGALVGDLASDGEIEGATRAVITYRSTVAQAYTKGYTQSEINEGDSVGNNAKVKGTFLASAVSLTDPVSPHTNGSEEDTSAAALTVPTHTVATSIVTVNGATPPANGELKPGDVVTFQLAYNLETGDYEQFKLTAYLPLPLFDLGAPGNFTGTWIYGNGDTNIDDVNSATVGAGNSLVFDFGSYANNPDTNGKRIEVQFTLTVGNQPFADQRSLTVLGQSDQLTTIAQAHLVSSGVVNIASIAEPVLAIKHGVVAVGAGSAGIVSGTTGTWAAAGTSGQPFTGSITDLAAVDGNVTGIDGGDLVRLATAIENTGGLGAFDVTTTITLPTGFAFAGGSLTTASLAIYRGNGTMLVLNTDYSVDTANNTITFLDPGTPPQPSLLPGRAGTAADTSGANVLVITYDVVAAADIAASKSLKTGAALTKYSSVNNGPDFTPDNLTDTSEQTVAAPVITKVFANGTLTDEDSSAAHTTGADLVIGESMLYDIVVTLTEGQTQTLRVDDLVPGGLQLDTSFGTGGYQLITTVAGSAALTADFLGSVNISGIAATPSGTLGADGVDARLTFSAASATSDNNAGNNSFVVRVRLIASNVSGNQAGVARPNSTQVIYSDPDGDTPNGSTAIDRTVALSGSQPSASIVEPTLSITQSASTNFQRPPGEVDAGDIVTYTITISNGTAASDFDAFDVSFSDIVPSELVPLAIVAVIPTGGATASSADFTLSGNTLTTTGSANIDIPKGGSVTLIVTSQVSSNAANVASFTNTAEVRWTSLNGIDSTPQTLERSGADGLLNGGSLNDYRRESALTLFVVSGGNMSHVGGLADTPAPSPTSQLQTVAVGEIIRYRVGFVLAEGNTLDTKIKVELPDGLSFINDGTAKIGLLSNTGIGNAADLTTGANPDIAGSVASMPDLLAADLSNTMTAVVDPSRIDTIAEPGKIIFSLGALNNTDIDLNKEVIYLDFNVRVSNTTAVDTTKSLSASAKLFAGNTQIDKTQPITESIVEPDLRNLQKTVTDFNPNTAGATGTATVTLAFSNSGDGIAYDSHLTDTMNGGSNYQLQSVIINGTTYLPGSLPGGVTVNTSGGITADFATIAIGTTVKLIYTVDVLNNTGHASTNATLTWTGLPESFTAYAGSNVGADGTAIGERDGSGTAPNTYIITEGAGLGYISGTLWDDTTLANGDSTPDGPGISGRTVTLTWAGLDGTPGNADDKSLTATTDANGAYHFGVLAAGRFTVTSAATIADHNFGSGDDPVDDLAARIDTDSVGNDATVSVAALGEGASAPANIGYVRENDAPVNIMPGAQTTDEDVLLPIPGISVTDVDAGTGTMQMTLSVKHGVLNLTNTSGLASSSGLGTATMTITGSRSTLNIVLASLTYMPVANYNGNDTLKVQTSDLGQFGDVDGDGTPGENPADALLDTDTVAITVTPVNDAPVANPDTATALEAGGWYNDVEGYPGYVNVLKNDTDVDIATNGDVLRVTKIGPGATANVAVSGDTSVAGLYGTLSIGPAGNATYVINETNALVQALRRNGDLLPTPEIFTYEMQDQEGVARTATITVTIKGANDTPVGNKDPVTGLPDGFNDEGVATEAGGEANGSGGSPATGNVLTNDVDVDAYGETKNVTAIRFGKESAATGVFTGVAAGTDSTTGTSVNGSYGTLKIGADGSYSYVVNQNATAVQRMVAGDTLIEYFSYVVTDALGDNDVAQIRITINGANDNPVASDDQAAAQAASTNGNAQEVNPTGNVILFQSRPGAISPAPGNGIDTDVDRTDQPNSNLVVTGIRTGSEGAVVPSNVTAGTTSANGTAIDFPDGAGGKYGTLTIGADGSFKFDVDSTNAELQALTPPATKVITFTYRIADTAGLPDDAQLIITIRGVNDPPVANDVFTTAVEAGGIDNGTPGTDPAGDATANDYDPDGDLISIVAARTSSGSNIPTLGGSIVLSGTYGNLTLNANGNYSYVLINTNLDVEALRTSSNTLTDTFIYTLSDNSTPTPETDEAQIIVTIEGRNDDPVGVNDTAAAFEAGGTSNTGGTNPTGNVLVNDTDADGGEIPADLPNFNYGETKAVSAFRSGTEAAGSGTTGVLGNEVRGLYGWLRLNDDGSYAYRVDNDEPAVEALLDAGSTLADAFTYTVVDAAGATDTAQLTITITGANDAPVAVADAGTAIEAGGLNNGSAGTNPTGTVLTNDSDVDNGDSKTVTALTNSASVSGTLGTALAGSYGSLTLNANGSYSYVVDNTNTTVQGLRTNSNTLTDTFTYIMKDTAGATSSTTLTITIRGANDNPLATNDTGTADEAGGLTPGSNATGDVLFNDTDVDNVAYGETKTVTTVRLGTEGGSGSAGTVGMALAGTYGALTLNANGSYTYVVDNNNLSVQRLRTPAETLNETFTYTMRDAAGASDVAQLTITIRGANDTPVALDDVALAWPPIIGSLSSGRNPTGNVVLLDFDIDAGDTKSVSGIRSGTEVAGGSMTTVTPGTSSGSGERVNGTYGWLNIGADGSYLYEVDFVRTASLAPTAIVQDYFTYELKDTGGLLDLAQLTVFIRGRNNPPIALPNFPVAGEAGGIANGTPGIDPAGDVTANDFDFEGDTLSVDVIRTGPESGSGTTGTIGSELAGTYGWLTQQTNGTFIYRVDNANPLVQALRSSGDTLGDFFTYTVSDIYGASDQATIAVTIRGANDNPVALDDVGTVDDPSALYDSSTGNVLPNDSDVDAYGETKTVASFANATGATTGAGGRLAGEYGNLVLNADGSYTYLVFNPDASIRAAGAAASPGTLSFVEEFVYTVRDAAGATAQATLRIALDVAIPYQEPGGSPFFADDADTGLHLTPLPEVEPAIFVERIVDAIQRQLTVSNIRSDGTYVRPNVQRLVQAANFSDDGSDMRWRLMPEIEAQSLGRGLGRVDGQFVGQTVLGLAIESRIDDMTVRQRHGVTSLSADGLLADPSWLTVDPRAMTINPEALPANVPVPVRVSAAPSFREQLNLAAQRLKPSAVHFAPASISAGTPRIS